MKEVTWKTAVLIAIVVAAAGYVLWRDGAERSLRVVLGDADLFLSMLQIAQQLELSEEEVQLVYGLSVPKNAATAW